MATITKQETGVRLDVRLMRAPGEADRVLVSANSVTAAGEAVRGTGEEPVELAGLTAPQRQQVANVLDLLEARLRARWEIA